MSELSSIHSAQRDWACDHREGHRARQAAGTAEATAVSVTRSLSSDITIVTAEGDKVTLSADSVSELSYASYDSKGRMGESGFAVAGEFHASRELSITVEGDLSRDELKDIRRAVKTIMKATRDALSGDPEKAAERVEKLGNLDQIASVEAAVTVSREVSVARVSGAVLAAPAEVSPETEATPIEAPPAPKETQPESEAPTLVLPPVNILQHLLSSFALAPPTLEAQPSV